MKTILSLAVIISLLGSSVGEAFWGEKPERPKRNPDQVFEKNDIERPADWDVMTREERREYLESQGFTPPPPRQMMHQKREAMIESQGIDLPQEWEDMEVEEKKEFLQDEGFQPPQAENARAKVEKFQTRQNFGQVQKRIKQARNYHKFEGKLEERMEFKDAQKIRRKDAVEFLQRRGIIDGYEDGTFGPENPINRAESLKVLFESVGEGPSDGTETEFGDVPEGAWFAGYVRKARQRNIAKGYEDGTFKPAKTVNQVELLKLAFETFGIDLTNYDVSKLPEGIDQSAWYAPYLAYALDNGLLDATSVDPSTGMTREEFSEVMYRLIKQQEELQGIDLLKELSKKGVL